MKAERAGIRDIERLTELRIAYLREDSGSLDPEDEKSIRDELPAYFRCHLDQDLFVWCVREEGNIVSCAFLLTVMKPMSPAFIKGRTGTVLNVYTIPKSRHLGCARMIMEALLKDAVQMDLDVIDLKATDAGYPLYRAVGFADDVSCYRNMKWKNKRTDEQK